eukprot:Colp12_sorted_trinity150504_noHs@31698
MVQFTSRLASTCHLTFFKTALTCWRVQASSLLLQQSKLPTYNPSLLLTQYLATLNNRPSLAARAAEFPEVVRQWHPTKNTLRPEDVAPLSMKRIWFICDEGHEWEASLNGRTSMGAGCPTCKLKRVTSTNNLLVKNPGLAAEWHPTKNGDLKPDAVSWSSGKKVWWECHQGHEWQAVISKRARKVGCRTCFFMQAKGSPRPKQSLLAAHPDLAQQWHPTKNGVLTPDAVSHAAGKKVWWQCPSDPAHEWEAQVRQRSLRCSGCPFCKKSPRPISETNNLLALYPEVAQEWHPTLNGELTADKVAGKSGKKVWWACGKCGHEWQAKVHARTANGCGCPKCAIKRRSK